MPRSTFYGWYQRYLEAGFDGLQDKQPARRAGWNRIPKRIKDQGALVSVPHPFSGYGRSSLDEPSLTALLPYVDLIEGFNARTMSRASNERARAFAQEHGLAATAVSDAHTLGELGHTYTELPDFDGTPEGFKEALREARLIERPAGRFVHVYTTLNKLRRKLFTVP